MTIITKYTPGDRVSFISPDISRIPMPGTIDTMRIEVDKDGCQVVEYHIDSDVTFHGSNRHIVSESCIQDYLKEREVA